MILRAGLFFLLLLLTEGASLRAEERPGEEPAGAAAIFQASQKGPFDALILEAAEDFGLDPWLLKGLLLNESGLRPELEGRGGIGLAQFTPAGIAGLNALRARRGGHAFEAFSMAQAREPGRAIPAAAELLAAHLRRWGRDGGIAAYQCPAHARAIRRWGLEGAGRRGALAHCGGIPLSGRYVGNVLRLTNRLRKAAGLGPLP